MHHLAFSVIVFTLFSLVKENPRVYILCFKMLFHIAIKRTIKRPYFQTFLSALIV